MTTENRTQSESQIRSSELVQPLGVTPLVKSGKCDHEWIKQPDGKTYVCWKCGEEKQRGAHEDKRLNAKAMAPATLEPESKEDVEAG